MSPLLQGLVGADGHAASASSRRSLAAQPEVALRDWQRALQRATATAASAGGIARTTHRDVDDIAAAIEAPLSVPVFPVFRGASVSTGREHALVWRDVADAAGATPGLRTHIEWHDDGLHVWFGANAACSDQVPRLADELARWLRRQGAPLAALTCNGHPWPALPPRTPPHDFGD